MDTKFNFDFGTLDEVLFKASKSYIVDLLKDYNENEIIINIIETAISTVQLYQIRELVPKDVEEESKGKKNPIKAIKLNDCKEAQQNGIYPYGTYCIICDGEITLYKQCN